ncbi:alpha-glucuronidase [Paenibacillus albicereus]|uniref:Xylan alpha-1,2-glucuronidase n=1 Tax=Paenibacillus albicereus TaxID=2726185 RepID=A0A6H2GUN2_9BACL|nr:alpha-glucuronidase family glycosyl hydrolase [Paenibacillus albicereus]QJC51102.1 alpha-glucuronidase [Paenibacillus albicereus]
MRHAQAEPGSGYDAWLGAPPASGDARRQALDRMAFLHAPEEAAPIRAALAELRAAAIALTGREPRPEPAPEGGRGIVLGTPAGCPEAAAAWDGLPDDPAGESYRLVERGGIVVVAGSGPAGVLYGAFHLRRLLRSGAPLGGLDVAERPANALRMINQWDNADGSVERGYAGRSIFYRDGEFVRDRTRIRDYARLLASAGINALAINNVNVHARETRFIGEEDLPSVAAVADILRGWGIRLYLSVNFAAPVEGGGLDTADPLDEEVRSWWREAADRVYRYVPDFGGFLVKADSEFRPGPFTYGRDHADGANMLADALAPHGGRVVWRCFVYDCRQDWRDRVTDRARAAYDHFMPLDGRFRDNVFLQVKNGPMDFQVREPVSPLIGAMPRTNLLVEFQIAQEYTGQQRHLCYLVPQWKEALDFDTQRKGEGSTVKRIASGELHGRPAGGLAAVSNIGDDANWTGHLLAQANLYGFGRLAWQPELSAEAIAREWAELTLGDRPQAADAVCGMLLRSWSIYESYTAPLGVGWMVKPHHHYGPDVDGYEYSMWGTYHFADRDGIGVDRSSASGTGYAAQYGEPVARLYESPETTPDELLLFFHHVPYTHRLRSGKTVIQHIYDSRFEGAERAQGLLEDWESLRGHVPEPAFSETLERFRHQAEHAREWRDVINTYFRRKSGMPDERGRTIY